MPSALGGEGGEFLVRGNKPVGLVGDFHSHFV
jgi:hypothetical protein